MPRLDESSPAAQCSGTVIHAADTTNIYIDRLIACGAFGAVYLSYKPNRLGAYDNTPLATKVVSTTAPSSMHQLKREMSIHSHLSAHHNESVVNLHSVFKDDRFVYFVMDFHPEGTLLQYIRNKPLGSSSCLRYEFSLQILDAVSFCHSKGVYHRDIKPENFLLCSNEKCIKITDFGLAVKPKLRPESKEIHCGSPGFMSPECLAEFAKIGRHAPYLCAPNDVWSIGVTLCNLLYNVAPWDSASTQCPLFRSYLYLYDFYDSQPHGRYFLEMFPVIPIDAAKLLYRIFTFDPQERVTLAELRLCLMSLGKKGYILSRQPNLSLIAIMKLEGWLATEAQPAKVVALQQYCAKQTDRQTLPNKNPDPYSTLLGIPTKTTCETPRTENCLPVAPWLTSTLSVQHATRHDEIHLIGHDTTQCVRKTPNPSPIMCFEISPNLHTQPLYARNFTLPDSDYPWVYPVLNNGIDLAESPTTKPTAFQNIPKYALPPSLIPGRSAFAGPGLGILIPPHESTPLTEHLSATYAMTHSSCTTAVSDMSLMNPQHITSPNPLYPSSPSLYNPHPIVSPLTRMRTSTVQRTKSITDPAPDVALSANMNSNGLGSTLRFGYRAHPDKTNKTQTRALNTLQTPTTALDPLAVRPNGKGGLGQVSTKLSRIGGKLLGKGASSGK